MIDGNAILKMPNKPRMLKDIEIGGKAAGEWRIGEEMEFFNDKHCLLESVKKVGPVLCGDIRLADDSDYIANGFVVTSQLVRVGAADA